jgi:hypothetical protein
LLDGANTHAAVRFNDGIPTGFVHVHERDMREISENRPRAMSAEWSCRRATPACRHCEFSRRALIPGVGDDRNRRQIQRVSRPDTQ